MVHIISLLNGCICFNELLLRFAGKLNGLERVRLTQLPPNYCTPTAEKGRKRRRFHKYFVCEEIHVLNLCLLITAPLHTDVGFHIYIHTGMGDGNGEGEGKGKGGETERRVMGMGKVRNGEGEGKKKREKWEKEGGEENKEKKTKKGKRRKNCSHNHYHTCVYM